MVYHVIKIEDGTYYRGFDEATGFYDEELFTEDELKTLLFDQVVDENVVIDEHEAARAVRCIPDPEAREKVSNYITYLEGMVEK
ncbi:hypothetical protein SAMN04488054_12140 [Salibacterium qingdaonense]|uniref:Uncharacterized protein n=2 Tax=Salibacterium qingdaonense TaxID=266892 RepID=A0A1I4NY97_9BACI|nr:hypothetical protein SAMN04488054_12140 [Salibacterium qingdaonense]